MSSEEKISGEERKNDITADELLVLLNKSVGNDASNSELSRSAVKTDGADSLLEIDDGVYRTAEDKLHKSDALTLSDDSDLDVDELIEKFINQPKRERESAAEQATSEQAALEEITAEQLTIEDMIAQEVADEEVPMEEVAEIEADTEAASEPEALEELIEELEEEALAEESLEDVAIPAEVSEDEENNGILQEVPLINEVLTDSQDSEAGDTQSEDILTEEYIEEVDTRKTTVFDISLVKKAAENADTEIDRIVDEAFSMAESASEAEAAADELPDAESVGGEIPSKVYGDQNSEEIDQTDLNLMIAFGMSEELKDAVGEEKAVEIEDDIIKKHEETAQMQAVSNIVEFTSREQADEILNTYKSKYYTLIIRIAAAFALLIGIFLIENFSLLGLNLPEFMRPTSYPMVYAMIDLQLIVLCGALAVRQIINGVKSLIALKPLPESLTAFAVAISIIYTFIVALIAPMQGFGLYNLPVAFAVLLSLVYEFLNVRREVLSFNVVSSKRKKFVVTPVSDATESLEREIFRDFVPADSKIIRVGKADFVDGFFARCESDAASKPIIGIMMPVVVILSILFMILAFIRTGSAYQAFTSAFVTAAITLPLTSFVIYSYPFYKASKDAFDCDSAIVGEASLAEYSDSSVISFEDKEVFPSGGVKVTSIKVYGNNRIDEIIYSLASAFIKVGGPLADVFSQATHDLGHSEDVELIEVDDDGFTVTIDDILVYIGKSSYMEKKDYDPPFDAEGRRLEQNGNIGVLYVAYAGQLAAKVYVQYTIDSEFESILAQLYKTGLCVGIKSFDPNIDDLLLAKKIKAMKYPVKVIRAKTVEDIPHTVERCDSGIVSRRSVKSLLKTVAACERVSRVIKTSLIVKVLAMLIGVVVMIFINAFGDKATISSLYLTLYQLFWTIPVFLISKFLV